MRTLVFGTLLAAATLSAQVPSSLDSLYLKNPTYARMTEFWRIYKTSRASAVMLGNSITQGVDWAELLGRPGIVNRGIGGDNLVGFLHRLQYVTNIQAHVCFIMGGINDLYAGFTVDQVFQNYVTLIDSLRFRKISPVVQSTLPVSPRWHDWQTKNLLVKELDDRLVAYCRQQGIDFVELRDFLTVDGALREEFTTDGVHLTPSAYALWGEALQPSLDKYGL